MLTIMLMLSQTAIAHDGPEEVITTLNAAILKSGPTAELLFRRASEFRAMRDYRHAAADLRYALRLDSSMEIARLELARLQLQLLKSDAVPGRGTTAFGEPLKTVEPLVDSNDPSIRIASLALRGEIHLAADNWLSAIEDLSAALEHRPEVQWYLWRAEAQQRSNQHIACAEGLRAADAETQSPVIKAALCDALIEAVRYVTNSGTTSADLIEEATSIIDLELRTSRLKSAWQIRHAELLFLCGDRQLAEPALHAAIEELNARLQTQRPDPALVRDRERAVKLLNPHH
jgi:tetratricopeptide (TPR) repeat protein